MNRVEEIRKIIDQLLNQNEDLYDKRCSFIHLYGVSTFCNLLALKRNLDPEIALTMGMLHDISSYIFENSADHHKLSSIEARKLLGKSGLYSEAEIQTICNAIYHHSEKDQIHAEYDELLKDADVLQHYFYNSRLIAENQEKERIKRLKTELLR